MAGYINAAVTPRDMRWGLRQGAIAGIVAGVVFAAFEMLASAFMMGAEAFFTPLRMIGAIALGPEALQPGFSLLAAGVAGLLVHVMLSIIYGIIFGEIATILRGPAAFIVAGGLFGLALWLVNFYVIAPFAFPWFLDSSPLVQFIGHTVFFGIVLGIYLWKSHQRSGLEVPAD